MTQSFTEREIQDGIYERAVNRASACDGSRVKAVPLSKAGEYVWHLQKTGALTSETRGDETTWLLFEFPICTITRRWSDRKIRLNYPELKPEINRWSIVDPTDYVEVWFENEWHAALFEKGVMTWRANGVQWKVENKEETMSYEYEKAEFDIIKMEYGKKSRETVSGYTFEAALPSGGTVRLGIDKRNGARSEIAWKVTDLNSGLMICEAETRAKATAKLSTVKTKGKTYLELYEDMLGTERYLKSADEFGLLAVESNVEDEMRVERKSVEREESEFSKYLLGNFSAAYEKLYEADYIPSELVDAGDKWMKAEHDTLMKLTAQRGDMFTSDREIAALALAVRWSYGNGAIRIENYDAIVGSDSNGDAVIIKPVAEEVEIVTAVTVDTLRELVKGHNVVVTQKNERSCIWVIGDTKPLKEELKDAGLRWAPRKQAWWYKPQAA